MPMQVFPFNNWVDKEHGLEHVLWPDRDGDGTADVGWMGDMAKYRVSVYTSDVRWGGHVCMGGEGGLHIRCQVVVGGGLRIRCQVRVGGVPWAC